MNHRRILKRAWDILWGYKTLWVFGILLALTMAGGLNGRDSNPQVNYVFDREWPPVIATEEIDYLPEGLREAVQELNEQIPDSLPPETVNTIIGVVIALACLALLAAVVMAVVHYISRTALIRMVDRYESSGEKVRWR